MGETGQSIAGPRTDKTFRDAQNYADQYGGSSGDYVKIKSDTSGTTPNGDSFQTHWVENIETGAQYDMKIKIQ